MDEEPTLGEAVWLLLWLAVMVVFVVPFRLVRIIWFAIFYPDEPWRINRDGPHDDAGPGNWRQR
jgi:hypothetical protein